MTDLALIWSAEAGLADLVIEGGGLMTEEGLRTAVLISLMTDRRARLDDALPSDDGNRRGWWGDVAAEGNDRIGSRLWLLSRAKATTETLVAARDHVEEALAWMIEDGVARALEITVVAQGDVLGLGLAIQVAILHPGAATTTRFDFVWSAS